MDVFIYMYIYEYNSPVNLQWNTPIPLLYTHGVITAESNAHKNIMRTQPTCPTC